MSLIFKTIMSKILREILLERFPVHWGGDCESTWEAMAEAMRGALSLTVSGFGYASHDIGGFEVCENCSVCNERNFIK